MIIDAHSHGFHGKYIAKIESIGGKWAQKELSQRRERVGLKPHYFDLALRLEQLNRTNIDLQVVTPGHQLDANLFPADAKAQLELAIALNDNMARLMEDSKGRLITGGCIPLEGFETGGRQEMERTIKNLGLKAISIPTNIIGKPLDLPQFESFWHQASEMDVPIFIHPTNPIPQHARPYETEYGLTHLFGWPFETALTLTRLIFSGIIERYPELKIVSHHLGGGLVPFFLGRITETFTPEYQQNKIGRIIPKPLSEYFSLFYYDTAVGGSAAAIRCAYEVFGADRIVFATDAPWGPGTGEVRLITYPKVIKSLGLSEAENNKIFEANARKILNLV